MGHIILKQRGVVKLVPEEEFAEMNLEKNLQLSSEEPS